MERDPSIYHLDLKGPVHLPHRARPPTTLEPEKTRPPSTSATKYLQTYAHSLYVLHIFGRIFNAFTTTPKKTYKSFP